MKKILFCASTISHILNFHLPYLEAFHQKGWEVWVAANEVGAVPFADHVAALPVQKSITSPKNVAAVLAARKLLKQQNFDVVSLHTTLASLVVRAALLTLKKRPRVYNTVHGFLFNETDGMKKWVYLLPEKLCARVTDVVMTMNRADHQIAQRHRLYKEQLCGIPGMGVALERYAPPDATQKALMRREKGIPEDAFVFVYAAEFSRRKNQAALLRGFARAFSKTPEAMLLLAGNGAELDACKDLARELGVEHQVRFLGYVKDMAGLYALCDACVSTSKIEGLPFNIVEALACGLPVVASRVKGHEDLIREGENGFLFDLDSVSQLEDCLLKMQSAVIQGGFPAQKLRDTVSIYAKEAAMAKTMAVYDETFNGKRM